MRAELPPLYTAPWVSGTRAAQYFGPIGIELFVADPCDHDERWFQAEMDLLESLQRKALELGANAVLGVEITLDPFAVRLAEHGLRLHAVGTAARLEALWGP